jgi:pyruvate formate lyase activating enzyme
VTAAAPPYVAPRSVKDTLTIAGLTRLSTCDWPGRLVATVFLQGCPWRCGYCHNPGLLDPTTPGQVPWQDVRDLLLRRQGMLDGVVFSGGEPTRQDGLVAAVHEVAELGYAVGLHTAGAYPRRLAEVLPLCEWVGLDIKALPGLYAAVTGVRTSGVKAYESLRIVLDSGVDHEVRITVDPSLHSREHVETLVSRLRDAGVRSVALQQARFPGTAGTGARTTGWRLTELTGRLPEGVFLRAE